MESHISRIAEYRWDAAGASVRPCAHEPQDAPRSPVMKAGKVDHVWSLQEIAGLAE